MGAFYDERFQRHNFLGTNGEISLDVSSDGDFETADLNINEINAYTEVYLEFFSDAALTTPVTPTGGTVTVSASPMGNVFITASQNSVINAADVSFPDATYTPAVIDGLISKAKISVAGIVGATHMRAILFTHE